MRAMILAAGLGTRLRPLTNDRPKALVEVAGRTMLEISLCRLRHFGVHDVIVNAHHFAEKVVEYLAANRNFGMNIEISREDVLLDTGGGLKQAADFFVNTDTPEPFILHNVDVISTVDLTRMMRVHSESGALATLAVQSRDTSRYLLFDEAGQLCGRRSRSNSVEMKDEMVRLAAHVQPLAFSGIHVISPQIFAKMKEEGVFSIIDCYLRFAAEGEKIAAFPTDEYRWRDLGRPESVALAAREMADGAYACL